MTITSTPATRVTRLRFSTSQEVNAQGRPRATNTSENPSTNRAAPATTRPATAVAPMLHVLAAHPGHVGEVAGHQRSTHGEANDTNPARIATARATRTFPSTTISCARSAQDTAQVTLDQVGEQGGLLLGLPAGRRPADLGHDPAVGVHDQRVGRSGGPSAPRRAARTAGRSNSDG